MSTRFEDSNSEAARVAAFFAADTAYATGFWVYIVSYPASGLACLQSIYNDDFAGVHINIDTSGVIEIHTDNTGTATTGSTLSTATWIYIWVRRDGTGSATWNLYLDGSTTADITKTDSFTGGSLAFGRSERDDTNYADIRILNPKFWDADKAASLAQAESDNCDHQSTGNAYSEWLLDVHTVLTDEGPGSRNLSAVGTLSTEADEPGWACGGEVIPSLIMAPYIPA